MKTVIDSKNELIINRSRFIALYYQVNSLIEVNDKIKNLDKRHKYNYEYKLKSDN